MKEKQLEINEYEDRLQRFVNALKTGTYMEAVTMLRLMQAKYGDADWKKELGILLSDGDNDFWSDLCIFNLCYTGTEMACQSGCCSSCCTMACIGFCIGSCCPGQEPGMCIANMIIKPLECCCGCENGCMGTCN